MFMNNIYNFICIYYISSKIFYLKCLYNRKQIMKINEYVLKIILISKLKAIW